MPPTAMPMSKHIARFHSKLGIAPQMDVPIKPIPAYRIDARRPILSPNQPHRKDPMTVPAMPDNASHAAGTVPVGLSGDLSPYSRVMPGITKASAVGFITSMVTATAMVSNRPTWAQLSGASSSALTRMFDAMRDVTAVDGGYSPYKLAMNPMTIAPIPTSIGVSI